MKILIHGNENKGAIAILISLCDITSENKVNAIYAYYVSGMAEKYLAACYHIDQSNLNKALISIEAMAKHIDAYNILRIAKKTRSQ